MYEHQASDLTRSGSMRNVRRTPAHRAALVLVRDGNIEWRPGVGPYGGFAPVGGHRFGPCSELVALYELRNAQFISVSAQTGAVSLTKSGMEHLNQWDRWQQDKAS